jgi:single-stranded-DNA-specific exonuclease
MPRDHTEQAFLGVERSLTGRRWSGPDPEIVRLAEAMVQVTDLPEAVCHCLAGRGVTADGAAAYLAPKLRDLLPDPRCLRDAERAAARLAEAVRRGERIAVFADYDVDGAASAAILVAWLREMGRPATVYVPDRIAEGYGPNVAAMTRLAAAHDLIVCVDCGTLAHEAIAAARPADVVVLDHHLGADSLPAALAVVNPNRADEDGALGHLCAASVVFLVLVETNRQLRGIRDAPDLMALLDLVALATVADVAPLVGVNRALVARGLEVMRQRRRPGLVALSDRAGLDRPPDPYHLGFVLGPRLNAGGRVGDAALAARLLATTDRDEAVALADRLETFNAHRRQIEAAVREAALRQAETRRDGALAWAAGDGWHPGVVGIVAARLKEATGRPAVVIGLDGVRATGSGRSVEGIDLGAAVQRLAQEGLVTRGGGHPMAAGLSLPRDGVEAAMRRLDELLVRQNGAQPGASLRLDGLVMPRAATPDLARRIAAAGPFGAGAPAPRFAFSDLTVRRVRRVGDGHLSITLGDADGGRIEAIAFRANETGLGAIEGHSGRPLHVAGHLEVRPWNGRESVQLRLSDAAFSHDCEEQPPCPPRPV